MLFNQDVRVVQQGQRRTVSGVMELLKELATVAAQDPGDKKRRTTNTKRSHYGSIVPTRGTAKTPRSSSTGLERWRAVSLGILSARRCYSCCLYYSADKGAEVQVSFERGPDVCLYCCCLRYLASGLFHASTHVQTPARMYVHTTQALMRRSACVGCEHASCWSSRLHGATTPHASNNHSVGEAEHEGLTHRNRG